MTRKMRFAFAFFLFGFATCKLIKDEPQCADVVGKFCKNKYVSSDLDILECLQNVKVSEITSDCLPIIRKHAESFFDNRNMRKTLAIPCIEDVKQIKCGDGKMALCVLDQKEKVADFYCQHIVQRLEYLVTADFSIVSNFKDVCAYDARELGCEEKDDKKVVLRDLTLPCLQKSADLVKNGTCLNEIIRLTAFQGEDAKRDLDFLLACASDKLKLCSHISRRQNSAVFQCLKNRATDGILSQKCSELISKKSSEDGNAASKEAKFGKSLVRYCKDDIRMYRCRRLVSDDRGVRLAQILLCLENAARNGSSISPECRSEMIDYRNLLMEDFSLSPEVASHCSNDIGEFCRVLEAGGKTIHCLLEHSLPGKKGRVSPPCQRALEKLLKVADVGEDWRVDPYLRQACQSVVRMLCPDMTGGDAKVMSCLMDSMNSKYMKGECSSALMVIQYFVSRDYKMDPQLYKACKRDATTLCHAKKVWNDDDDGGGNADPERGPLVLPCLYRYAYHSKSKRKLKPQCEEEVRRVMRQRAIKAELLPEVEMDCLNDLAEYCRDKTGPGQEMICLQDHFQKLRPGCKETIGNFTEAEAGDVDLNPVVKSECAGVIRMLCGEEMRGAKRTDRVMDCLITHKNDADVKVEYKCRAAVEHFQLIGLNDYHFTVGFKEACRPHVIRYCSKARTKAQVVECLSEVVRNDTLKDEKYKIPKECRFHLRAQLLQQRESLNLDPKLKSACETDINYYCSNVSHDSGQVLECLKAHLKTLKPDCHKSVFRIEQQDFFDSSSDYTLLATCKQMLEEYCKNEDESRALECLKRFRNELGFDPACKSMVSKRLIEQSADYRLNPALAKACDLDIKKFCYSIVGDRLSDVEYNGKVVKCLKIKFRERKIRKTCANQLFIVLKESALNYALNPLIRNLCTSEIRNLCGNEAEEEEEGEGGKVEECLKIAFMDGRIVNRACRLEVAGLIEEGKADIHVDPLLHRACALDVQKFCADVPQGSGRILQCLLQVLGESYERRKLQADCEGKLAQRMEMFKNADNVITEPRNFEELYGQMARSPSKNYFEFAVVATLCLIFTIGVVCGRLGRQNAQKNK